MYRRPAQLLLSAAAWLGFVLITVWTMAFLADVVVPWTVDGPERMSTAPAVGIDLALLLLFAVQHSVMARRQVKSWLSRRIPKPLERTSYVLATDICLALLLVLWQPWGGQIWDVGGAVAVVVWSLFALGWVLAIIATFAVDHLELVGLRQAGWAAPRDPGLTSGLSVRGLHAVVRHPLMTGLLVAFWATPQMGASHLLFALASTGYIAVGIRFEERDLRRTFGASYDVYAARVPALLPGDPAPAKFVAQPWPYIRDPGVVSLSPVSRSVLRPERIIGQPPYSSAFALSGSWSCTTVSRQESPTCSISQVTRVVPCAFTSSLHRAVNDCTSRWGGSTTRFSPSAMATTPGTPARYVEPVVQSDWVWTPKLNLARIAGSVMASQIRSGVALM